ncbi:MAG: Gfo/Idh/MocA family oxidoreductase [Parasporobacterium sp.]|nr:Gfo/Idh/MocA family oxidoreductase [Parasporobacterium sp.]
MKKMNVGVVGAGFMGKAHCVALSNMPKLFPDAPYLPVFKTVCDIDPEIAVDFCVRFGFKGFCTDYMDIINDPEIDIVAVCTPNDSHAEIAIAALEAGKHVICEKPMAITVEQSKAMAEAAAKAFEKGKISMCGYQYRRVPAIEEAKKIIDSGAIGQLTNVRAQYLQSWSADPRSPLSWRFVKETAGAGTLGDIFTHALDIAQYLAGDVTELVSMVKTYIKERPVQEGGVDLLGTVKLGDDAKKQAVDVDDEVSILCKYAGGAIGSVEATRMAWGRNNYITIEVHGTKGSITWNYERLNELEVCYGMDDEDGARGFRKIYTGPANPHGDVTWNIPGMNIGYGELKAIEAYDFAKAVEGGYQPTTTFEVGYQISKVCDAILKSDEVHGWVTVE